MRISTAILLSTLTNFIFSSEPIKIENEPPHLSHLHGKEIIVEDACGKLDIQLHHLVVLGQTSHPGNKVADYYLRKSPPKNGLPIWYAEVDNKAYCLHHSWLQYRSRFHLLRKLSKTSLF
jgi:hypothetical protein